VSLASRDIAASGALQVIDLGALSYDDAYRLQLAHHEEVLTARASETRQIGRLLLVEHDPPVITVSRRKGARDHLVATEAMLKGAGVTVSETDRGGDITYHGPGQLVAYPILDLNALGLNLHAYMRFLEQIAIDVCARFGVPAGRDDSATGVWVGGSGAEAKICAIGVRVRKWITMHGLALNVTTNLDHFGLIVPCGLVGRPVTSLERELGDACPSMADVKSVMVGAFETRARECLSGR
jgi:lipoyl(octanoyl) transferase